MKLIKTKFKLADGPAVEGYVEPHRPDWNGYARPWFTKAQVEHMMAAYDTHAGFASEFSGHFDIKDGRTTFVLTDNSTGGVDRYDGEEHPEIGQVYAVGAGFWMWEEVPEMGTWLPIRTAPRDGSVVLTDAGLCYCRGGMHGLWYSCDDVGERFFGTYGVSVTQTPTVWTPFTTPTLEEIKEINK